MSIRTAHIYPDCPTTIRTVNVGGLTKLELLEELQRNDISLNEAGKQLFANDLFTTCETQSTMTTVELTVSNLGFLQGATTTTIYAQAATLGLGFCPLELGPHLRLQYRDQPEGAWGKPVRHQQAPYGSITIASEPLTNDDDVPKGFYLRRIMGDLWLRGYCSGAEHMWDADDHFIFVKQAELASAT